MINKSGRSGERRLDIIDVATLSLFFQNMYLYFCSKISLASIVNWQLFLKDFCRKLGMKVAK